MDSFKLNPSPKKEDLESILGKTWGESSVLTYVGDILSEHEVREAIQRNTPENLVHKTVAVTVEDNGVAIGCAVIKVNPGKEIELGSLAVLPKYRGRGVATTLMTALKPTCDFFIKHNYSLAAFATIGSAALFTVLENLEKLSGTPPLVLQFTPGVIPVETPAVLQHIAEPQLVATQGTTSYTATLQLICTRAITYDTTTVPVALIDAPKNVTITSQEFTSTTPTNSFFDIPINLVLATVHDSDLGTWSQFRESVLKQTGNKTVQYRIPLSRQFTQLIKTVFKSSALHFTGFTLVDSYVHMVFLERVAPSYEAVETYLAGFPQQQIASLLGRLQTVQSIYS